MANIQATQGPTTAGTPMIELVAAVTDSQLEYTLLTMASSAKVAIEPAMPDRRMIAAPTISATSPASKPPPATAGWKPYWFCCRKSGSPVSIICFQVGSTVAQAAA